MKKKNSELNLKYSNLIYLDILIHFIFSDKLVLNSSIMIDNNFHRYHQRAKRKCINKQIVSYQKYRKVKSIVD